MCQKLTFRKKYWDTDDNWLKAYIFAIWILDTAHQALLLNFTYIYFVKGIVQPGLLLRVSRWVALLSSVLSR